MTDDRCLAATPILDHDSPIVRRFAASIRTDGSAIDHLREAHRSIGHAVAPVYSVDERQPASHTLARGKGSCSQRFAVLESVARTRGIPTRVRGIEVLGEFWYPRFGVLRPLIPRRVVLAWPSFLVEGAWLDASELFTPDPDPTPFTNDGESLFDAVGHARIDWDGTASTPSCDLSGVVGRSLGVFDARDDLFAMHATSPAWLLRLADPVLRHWTPRSAG